MDLPITQATAPTHYVFCVDISGSMYSSLRKLREELKNKLSSILKAEDLLTIIWFSGKNDAGFVFKQVNVGSAKELNSVHQAIDKWLQADCLTAFDKPIRLAGESVIEGIDNAFLFLTDGYNNSASKADVMAELEKIKGKFNSYALIEYGTYCDSRFIADMAQVVGATQSVKEGIDSLVDEIAVQLSVAAAPRIAFQLPYGATHLFGFDGETLIVYPVEGDTVYINANTIYGIPVVKGYQNFKRYLEVETPTMDFLILALGFAMLNEWENVETCIAAIGDETLLNSLGGAYGIQKIEGFKILLLEAIKGNVELTPTKGAQIDENALCVMDVLEMLTKTKGNYLLPDHEAFNYKRIGLAKTAKVAEDVKEAASAAGFFGFDAPVKPIEFIKFEGQQVELNKLTFNTKRANVSLLATYNGTVVNIPANEFGINEYDTVIHRNYTIIQDGRLNVTHLPVKIGSEFLSVLTLDDANKIFDKEAADGNIWVIDFSKLPIINRKRIKALSAQQSVEKAFELLKVQAALKVIKTLRPDNYNAVKGVDEAVGDFLKSIGITEQGFAPKVETAEAKDFYFAPELSFKFAGASALPSVEKVQEKLAKIDAWAENPKGKEPTLNLAEALMAQAFKLASVVTEDKATEYAAKINKRKRELEVELAGITSTLILSRGWFSDKKDFEDNQITLLQGELGEVTCTIQFRDIQVEI